MRTNSKEQLKDFTEIPSSFSHQNCGFFLNIKILIKIGKHVQFLKRKLIHLNTLFGSPI